MDNKVRAVFDLLGVEPNETFDIAIKGTMLYNYYLTEDLVLNRSDDTVSQRYTIADLLTGKVFIEKKPFVPKVGEAFYYVTRYCNTDQTINSGGILDSMLVRLGNCYRTKEDATRDTEKWKEFCSSTERINWDGYDYV